MYFFETPKEEIIKRIQKMDNYEKGNEEILFWAAINGHNDILEALITSNLSDPIKFPLKINMYFNLALRYAAMHEHEESIKILLKAGADKPTHDNITIKRFKKKTQKQEDTIVDYTSLITSGCKKFPDRYNLLLLDWIMDNCSLSIFNKLKEHIEKNHNFVYTNRPTDPETGQYMSRWEKRNKKSSKAVK